MAHTPISVMDDPWRDAEDNVPTNGPPGLASVRRLRPSPRKKGKPRLTGMICKAAATASSRIHLQQRMPRAASSASNRAPTARARGEGRSCAPAARSSLAASTGIVVTSHCLATSTLLLSARSAPRWSPISATTTNQRPGGAAAVQARGPVSLPAHPAHHGAAERANAHEAAPAKLHATRVRRYKWRAVTSRARRELTLVLV